MQRSTSTRTQHASRSCGWCNKKASTRSKAHTHTIDECPELAKATCGFCKESGHTTGHCPVRKDQSRARRRDRRQAAQTCDSEGYRVCGGKSAKPSVTSDPSRALTSVNPFATCELAAPTGSRKPAPAQDRFECEKCGFQHSCLEVVEEHEAWCAGLEEAVKQQFRARSVLPRPRSEVSWADMAEDPDAEIEPPVWDDELVFPALKPSDP